MAQIRITRYLIFAISAMAVAQTSSPMPVAARQALVARYCSGCHNDRIKSGGFSWTKLDPAHPERNADQAEKVIRKLRAGLMPPPGAPRPDVTVAKAFAASLEAGVDEWAAAHPNPGGPALHRLNRTEYRNSVRDLLDLDIDAAALLPPDDMSHGFDNMSDVLTVSPALMESYVRAAGEISRRAVGDRTADPVVTMYNVPKMVSQTAHVDGAPFGTRGGISVMHNFPADGEYTFQMTFYGTPAGVLFGQTEKGQQIEVSVDGQQVALLNIDPRMREARGGLQVKTGKIKIKGGPRRLSAAFVQTFDGPVEDEVEPFDHSLIEVSVANGAGVTTLPHLHALIVTGPFDVTGISETSSRRRIFTCHPASESEQMACAKQIVSRLARQAFRRPAADRDIETLMSFYQQGRNRGDFESGIQLALQSVLADPEFVFRFEHVPPGTPSTSNFRISDLELASRLSYFLWSSAPDDQLIRLASQNKLHEPAILEREVRRMLADPRSESLSTNFAYHWLRLQNLKDVQPDSYLFSNYDRNLADSMLRETELLFDSIVREDRNILDLLTADYTFVNERLARYYGIPDILGNSFRRVSIREENRRGLLGQGSILTLTSIATRTSPVARGKYVMEVLLGTPPPPPPPNVPPLKENAEDAKPRSLRELMEAHRQNEPCASCHKMMDPIGFSLENFDAVGSWRDKDNGKPIDASGQMFDGTKLDGPQSLRRALLQHSDSFIGSFTESLFAYGLGRVIESADMPAVRVVEREAARDENRFSAFILAVVKSTPFQMRRAAQESPAPESVARR